MNKEELLRYGNELTICGFIVGNAKEHHIFFIEDVVNDDVKIAKTFQVGDADINQVIRQMDVQEIGGLQKVILRKSQRQIDQRVSWKVFRRDNFTCVYCGADDVPMTVDHIVLWEHMGDSVPDNLNCSCKKCNKTRGSMNYDEWLQSKYLINAVKNNDWTDNYIPQMLKVRGDKAKTVPLRKTKRSR